MLTLNDRIPAREVGREQAGERQVVEVAREEAGERQVFRNLYYMVDLL